LSLKRIKKKEREREREMIRKNVLFRALLLFRSRYFFSFVRIDFYVHTSMLAELIRMNFTFISKKKEKKLKKLAIVVFLCFTHDSIESLCV